jgi:hypothetical protein
LLATGLQPTFRKRLRDFSRPWSADAVM